MIQPSALNVLIIGLSVVIFSFLWRMASSHLVARNPESALGKGMASIWS